MMSQKKSPVRMKRFRFKTPTNDVHLLHLGMSAIPYGLGMSTGVLMDFHQNS
jgi:hypothetical protein